MPFHASFTKLWSFDLISEIALYASWASLIAMSHWPGPAFVVVEREKRNRIFDALATYIPRRFMLSFFTELSESDGAIFGPVVWEILDGWIDTANPKVKIPTLDIAVRSGMNDSLHRFLVDLGFSSKPEAPPAVYRQSTGTVEVFTKVANGKVRSSTEVVSLDYILTLLHKRTQNLEVRVFDSRNRALNVILASPSTIHMNAITADTVISFYPRLTFKSEGLVLQGKDVDVLQDACGRATLTGSNAHWTRKCGIYCPEIWRKSCGDGGIAQYPWSQRLRCLEPQPLFPVPWGERLVRLPGDSDPLLDELVFWKFLDECRAPDCPNRMKHDARSQYLRM
ncbi:hypothetical protein NMY22_g14830 [Coprinellus aureogranulatus]|nr:hypothetical protein NMY22_g14830 [Coprinellus aureogranulatus]